MSQTDLSSLSPEEQQIRLDEPTISPPPGVDASLDDPPNGNDLTRAVVGVALAICSFFVLVHIFGSWSSSRKLRINDLLLITSFGSYVAYSYFVLDSTDKVGYLLHQWDIRMKDMIYLIRNFTIGSDLFAFSALTIKTAIILEWLRIFNPTGVRNGFYWISYAVLALNFIFHVTAFVVFNVACKPYEKNWNPFIPGSCYDTTSIYVASTAIYLVVDVCILLLPQKAIWGLQMPTKKKLGVAGMFMVGILAIATVILRLVLSIKLVTSSDSVYNLGSLGILVIAEMACGIIILCVTSVPTMLALLRLNRIFLHNPWTSRIHDSRTQVCKTSRSRPGTNRSIPDFRYNQDIEPLGSYQLHTMESAGSAEHDSASKLGTQPHCEDLVIRRTTDFTAVSVRDISYQVVDDQFNRQHPWN